MHYVNGEPVFDVCEVCGQNELVVDIRVCGGNKYAKNDNCKKTFCPTHMIMHRYEEFDMI